MTTLREGEIWLSDITGEIYKIKKIANQMVVLQSVSGLNQILTSKESLSLFYVMVPTANDANVNDSRSPSERNRLSPTVG